MGAEDSETTDPRRTARLQAVQALYQLEQTEASPEKVVAEFERHPWPEGEAEPVDLDLFRDLVLGAAHERAALDALIGPLLSEGWSMPRLSLVLAAILRAGAFELANKMDVPPRATISEYVEIADRFLAADETGLVNALLDRLARGLRPAEMSAEAIRRIPA